jgi:hypothetical protein
MLHSRAAAARAALCHARCLTRAARQGDFTKTASQRAPAGTAFVTGVDKPRVHKDVTPS